MSPQQVLNTAQRPYEKYKEGYCLPPPRTDCGYLPESMHKEIPSVLDAIGRTDPEYAPLLFQFDKTMVSRIWNDKKITAHHGIIPTRNAFQLSALNEVECRGVYADPPQLSSIVPVAARVRDYPAAKGIIWKC